MYLDQSFPPLIPLFLGFRLSLLQESVGLFQSLHFHLQLSDLSVAGLLSLLLSRHVDVDERLLNFHGNCMKKRSTGRYDWVSKVNGAMGSLF